MASAGVIPADYAYRNPESNAYWNSTRRTVVATLAAMAAATDYLVKNLRYLAAHPELHRGQAAAGETAKVGQPAISKILTEKTKEPGYRTVLGLARHYGITVDDLLNRDIEHEGTSPGSQGARFDDATMAQALELLYLMADARPDDRRFARITWPMVLVAAKAITRKASQRETVQLLLEEMRG